MRFPLLPHLLRLSRWPSLLCLAVLSPVANRADDPASPYEVETHKDVAYYEGENADPIKHKLDLYLPKGVKDYPVLFFVHGGAWISGDKKDFGVYSGLGRSFARAGIGTVVINYRLSPGVKHPEHIKDVARAFAWTHKNIAKYGGRPDRIFVSGHSAGGHLIALLTTNEQYLKAEGRSIKDIRGAIPLSGVYELPDRFMPNVFGTDAEVRKSAEPLSHVRAGEPPFLILYAEQDFPGCGKIPSEAFCKALKNKENQAESMEIKGSDHIHILLAAAKADDPVCKKIIEFIKDHAKK